MNYTINIPLEFYYDGDMIKVTYPFIVNERLSDIIEYLYEEEYGIKYNLFSWYLQDGSREFINNLQTLWNENKLDLFYMYTKDYRFIEWLISKYEEDARFAFMNEQLGYYEEDEEDIEVYPEAENL